jgi:hypothetical protein
MQLSALQSTELFEHVGTMLMITIADNNTPPEDYMKYFDGTWAFHLRVLTQQGEYLLLSNHSACTYTQVYYAPDTKHYTLPPKSLLVFELLPTVNK